MTINKLFLVIATLYMSINYVQPNHVKNNDWDVLIFTQEWPTTVCREWKKHNPSHTCTLPHKHDAWAIHGIWPTKYGTIGPQFCNRTWHFDPEQIKPIETELTESWLNIYTQTSTYSLWAHEWTKHGTCAAVLETFNSEFKYFSHGLDFMHKYAMNNVLGEADITPSDTTEYSILDIHNALKVRLGTNPAIECRIEDGKSYLIEIRICFSKDLKLINCDGIKKYRSVMVGDEPIITNCDTSKGIIYSDATPPNKIYVQLYKLASWIQWFTL